MNCNFRLLLLFVFISTQVMGQIRMEVVSHAPFLSSTQRLFIAGDFNNWQPGDPNYELIRLPNGHYYIQLPDSLQRFEYKFTQGSWTLVEADSNGIRRSNRLYVKEKETNPYQINIQILGWETKPIYRFLLKSVPPNTPHDAVLYMTGNFNNWNPGDEHYRLTKQIDGTYRVSLISDLESIEFKFTRGDWASVEGQANGRSRPNRLIFKSNMQQMDNIPIEIESWEDLTGTFHFFSIFDLLLLFSAFHSILLIVGITSLQDYNRQANRWLVIALAFIAFVTIVRVVTAFRDVAQVYTKWLLLPDFVLFLYAPLFYLYIQKLLFKLPKLPAQWWGHFIPAAVQLLFYLPYFLIDNKTLQLKIVNQELDLMWLFRGVGGVAWVVNGYYWLKCRQAIRGYHRLYAHQASHEQNTQYLTTVLNIQAVCLVLWFFTGILFGLGNILNWDIALTTERSIDIIWLVFSTIPYFLGYFAIQQPEIFKLPPQSLALFGESDKLTEMELKTEKNTESVENLLPHREKIDAYMTKYRPYTNAGLTLTELANKLKMQPHLLSKVINEVYQKNFFDFINEYRIEEFKQRFEDPHNKHFTMLAIAFEVGFNSKTAFNRAFKKMTQQTPREYFYDSRVEE